MKEQNYIPILENKLVESRVGGLNSNFAILSYTLKEIVIITTLTAKQIFEKLSFGSCEANCLFMFTLTRNYVLN